MGKFVVKKAANDKYMFNLKAGNGATIATSQNYKSYNSCLKGIESVRKSAIGAVLEDQTIKGHVTEKNPKFELYKDKTGGFRFRLKASNGEIILKSEGYTVKASCKNGIASVIKNGPKADVINNS